LTLVLLLALLPVLLPVLPLQNPAQHCTVATLVNKQLQSWEATPPSFFIFSRTTPSLSPDDSPHRYFKTDTLTI
jgi:hypothetical protein